MTKETFMIEEISKEIVWLLIQEHQMDMMRHSAHSILQIHTHGLSTLTRDSTAKVRLMYMSILKENWLQEK